MQMIEKYTELRAEDITLYVSTSSPTLVSTYPPNSISSMAENKKIFF